MTLTPVVEVVETFRWSAAGFTDEVTECEHCGKSDLRGTVRMVARDDDGDEVGEKYMGTTCAARMTGRKSTEIRTEANRADRARLDAARELWRTWSDAQTRDHCQRRDAVLGRNAPPAQCMAWMDTPQAKAGAAAWLADNPKPPNPWQ